MIGRPIAVLIGIVSLAAVVSAVAPLEVAMLSVLAFAGPHNWFELRYLLGRLPSRLSPFRGFFLTAAAGVVLLSAGSIALTLRSVAHSSVPWGSLWLAGLAAWIATLVALRAREVRGRSASWAVPAALLAAAAGWWSPSLVGLALVYLHPLVALWFLDRELRARRRTLRSGYRRALWLLPAALALIWVVVPPQVAQAAAGPGAIDAIGRQAGASLFGAVGGRLIATHAFLELVHYGVWIVLIPMVAVRGRLLRPADIPFRRRPDWLGPAVVAALGVGAVVAGSLWVGFALDYQATRDLYFTVAIVHVLVEVPALVRLL
ncbi:MAG: hypothetical protein AB7R55_03470 [Gemmatimonadales bacterium]